jgi:hypothetical protein
MEEDIGCATTFRVSSASSAGGCGGESSVRITAELLRKYNSDKGTHLASSRLCIVFNIKLTYISALRRGLMIR